MAEGRDPRGPVRGAPRWWQAGSKEKKPSYFKDTAAQTFWRQQKPKVQRADKYYNRQFKLIDDRNKFYAKNKDMRTAPTYSFGEAASLYQKGYAGVFGRSANNQTVSLLGQPWQQAYALNALRQNKDMLEYGIVSGTHKEETTQYKELMAADRTGKTWRDMLDLYSDWTTLGGLEGYKDRYGKGKPPGETSKYRIIMDVNNQAAKKDDIKATYQNNLATTLNRISKNANGVADEVDDPKLKENLKRLAKTYQLIGADGKISTTEKRGEPNDDKIRAMESAVSGYKLQFDKTVEEAVGTPSASYSKRTLSATLGILGGPVSGQIIGALANTDQGQKIANNMIGRAQMISQPDQGALAKVKVDWGWRNLYGGGNLNRNIVTGLARFGIGIVPGTFAMVDEGLLAAREGVKAAKGEKQFGDGVDFKMGDAIWADFAQRYYDPFAYKTNANGEEEFQGFWSGLANQDDWGDFANKVGEDPVSYVLDVLDVAPVVGWAAKVGSVAAVTGRLGRGARIGAKVEAKVAAAEADVAKAAESFDAARQAVRERVQEQDITLKDMTSDERIAWRDADLEWTDEAVAEYQRQRATIPKDDVDALAKFEAENPTGKIATRPRPKLTEFIGDRGALDVANKRLASAENILFEINRRPDLIEVLDEAQIQEAAKMLSDSREVRLVEAADEAATARKALTEAEANLLEAKRVYDSMPSVRRFRQVARQALAGDQDAKVIIDGWKAAGFDFNGAENSRALRFSASFEPRTKVLEPTDDVIAQNDLAVVRMPASPIARGIKDAVYWAGKIIVDPASQGAAARLARAGEKRDIAMLGRIAGKIMDMPRIGYRWNYTRAVENSLMDDFGDTATFMQAAADLYRLQEIAELPESAGQAILSVVYGGTGALPTNAPFLRRRGIEDQLDEITVDGRFVEDENGNILSEFVAGTEDQAEALLQQRNSLLADTLDDIETRADTFDSEWQTFLGELRQKIANPRYSSPNIDDLVLAKAAEVTRRMIIQKERIAQRFVHTGTTPQNIDALRNIYTEVMNDLRITPKHLFGDGTKPGVLSKYVSRVARLNSAILPALTGLIDNTEAAIIDLAQNPRGEGTVFDRLTGQTRITAENDWVRFVRTVTEDGDGLFRRGDSAADQVAAPVIVMAASQQGVPRGFSRVHLPRVRYSIDSGMPEVGKIVDEQEAFIIPNEFLVTKKQGKRRVVSTSTNDGGRKMLEVGSLNAMSDLFPNARFYSEKVSESGLMGSRINEKQAKNEHVIAASGLREHSLGLAIRSEVAYYRARVEDSLVRQAEENAILVPAAELVGKSPNESGYRILAMVRTFNDVERARAFAYKRGVGAEFDAALEDGFDNLPRVQQIHNADVGLSIIDGPDGPEYVVRGNVKDWAKYSTDEDITTHTIMSDYKKRMYDDPDNIDGQGMVLAIPNIVDKKLSLMVIEGNTYASRLFDHGWAKATTNAFKRIVLNFRLGFITSNVVGGTSMLMARNPMAAARILARVIAKQGRLAGDSFVAEFAGNSAAVDRQLAMEIDQNVYVTQDAGVAATVREPDSIKDTAHGVKPWLKKYIWNGGYTTVAAFERSIRNAVAIDFLLSDPTFRAFMDGPEVARYIDNGEDYYNQVRPKDGDNPITKFEAAADLLLDRTSPFFNAALKHRMRYTTNTVSGNYHRFSPTEQMLRNFIMPFYAWQRHSLTYMWRMAVDKPITASALYHIGQEGYNQVSEQGIPEYLMETVPLPEVLKEQIGVIPEDFRVDASSINPFGATTQLASALYRVISGDTMGGQAESIFRFANPYLNNLIKDTLGVDPVTGRIDWERLSSDNNGKGIFGSTTEMATGIGRSTWAGSLMKAKNIVEDNYEQDARANMYPAIESAADAEKILKNMYTTDAMGNPISKGLKGWQLSVPEPRTAGNKSRAVDLFSALGFKSYILNSENLENQSRDEFVAGMALAYYNNKKLADEAKSDVTRYERWLREKEYVDWWIEQARRVGVDEATIQVVKLKIQDQKPKDTKIDPNLLISIMGG